jgi:hypothetical protein
VIRLAALFVVLAFTGCAQGTTGQAVAPNAPHSQENNGIRPERGGGDLVAVVAGACSWWGAGRPRRSTPKGVEAVRSIARLGPPSVSG